jgi:hypothetical protein
MQIKQVYELKLYVNHQMTHICNSRFELKEDEKCVLMEVDKIERAPRSSGEDGKCDLMEVDKIEIAPRSSGEDGNCDLMEVDKIEIAPRSIGSSSASANNI